LASTFIGGNLLNYSSSLALDGSGSIYLTGRTFSKDFPTTPGAFKRIYDSGNWGEVFISKLSNDLTSLLASTYLGTCEGSWGYFLALGSLGEVYVAGKTNSSVFPTTSGSYDTTYNGEIDVFISKLNSDLTKLTASTFFGGSKRDSVFSMTLDDLGYIYLTGETASPDFPTTSGAYDRTFAFCDLYVSKLNNGLNELLASTFLGGKSIEHGYAVALDNTKNVYVTGLTESVDFPTTSEAFSRSFRGMNEAFVAKLNGMSVNLDLQAERREIRAFSILRHYGQIQFMVETHDVPVLEYRILRRQGNGDLVLLKTIASQELQNNQFQMQDRYLEKDTPYTYRIEAYIAGEQLVGISMEKTI
jgi:hypothetical protein